MQSNPIIAQTLLRETRFSESRVSDLRRVKSRDLTQVIAGRASFLAPSDRALLEQVYVHGRPATEIALAAGISPKILRRRVKHLVARVLHPAYSFVLLRRETWPRDLREVGSAVFVEGCTLREASRSLGMTYHAARVARDAVLAMSEGDRVPKPGPSRRTDRGDAA